MYYARFQGRGKEIRRSLGATDKATVRRKLGDLKWDRVRVDLAAGKRSLSEACDRYSATVQNQKPETVERKTAIARQCKVDLPDETNVALAKVLPCKIPAWLAGYDFGAAPYNLLLEFIQAMFNLAVEDRPVLQSPVTRLKTKRSSESIR